MAETVEKKQNWFMRHKLVTGILVIVVVFMLIGSLNGGSNTSTSNGSNDQASSSEEANQAPAMAMLNQPAQSGDLAFTATKVVDAKTLGNAYTKKNAQGVFKVVSLKIDNTGKETKTVDSSMLKLRDGQGRTFERSIDGQTAKGMTEGSVDLFLQQVQPGLSVNGDIVFDVPADATDLVLVVRGGLFEDETEISLK